MEILKFPDKRLLTKTREVTIFGDELNTLLESMWDTMIKNQGVGLASNQVGLTFSMLVMLGPDDEKIFMVNPKVTKQSEIPANLQEGCLSAPGEWITVPDRISWVLVEYQDELGEKIGPRVFKDIFAVCVQHEMEHLQGKAFLQSKSIQKLKRKKLVKKWGL